MRVVHTSVRCALVADKNLRNRTPRSTLACQPFGQDQRQAWLGITGSLRMADGGHDFLSDLNDPASLAAGLTTQALKGLPLAHTLLGDQRALGLLDHHPGIQGPLELAG